MRDHEWQQERGYIYKKVLHTVASNWFDIMMRYPVQDYTQADKPVPYFNDKIITALKSHQMAQNGLYIVDAVNGHKRDGNISIVPYDRQIPDYERWHRIFPIYTPKNGLSTKLADTLYVSMECVYGPGFAPRP